MSATGQKSPWTSSCSRRCYHTCASDFWPSITRSRTQTVASLRSPGGSVVAATARTYLLSHDDQVRSDRFAVRAIHDAQAWWIARPERSRSPIPRAARPCTFLAHSCCPVWPMPCLHRLIVVRPVAPISRSSRPLRASFAGHLRRSWSWLGPRFLWRVLASGRQAIEASHPARSEEHTSELQS